MRAYGPRSIIKNPSSALVLLVLTGCASDTTEFPSEPVASEVDSRILHLVEQDYPFDGESGEIVCGEWQYETSAGDGSVEVEREWYDIEKMNQQLSWTDRSGKLFPAQGRVEEADLRGALAAARAEGLARITSCEDARAFVELKTAHLEGAPSKRAGRTIPRMELSPESASVPADESAVVDKVSASTPFWYFPTVRVQRWANGSVSTCSGTLIDEQHLLTSAHCFPSNGLHRVTIDYGSAVSGNCLTPYVGCGRAPSSASVNVTRHPSFTGSGDTADDIAVLRPFLPWPAPANTNAAWLRFIATDVLEGDNHWLLGYGETGHTSNNMGVGRLGNSSQGVEWSGTYHWLNKGINGVPRTCIGDSGGTAVNQTLIPADLLIGIPSNYSGGSNQCPYAGDKYRFTALEHKAAWIDSLVGCTDHSQNGIWYKRCW